MTKNNPLSIISATSKWGGKAEREKEEDDGTEWMWVEVITWKGQTINGVLLNEPHSVNGLHAGARVEVNETGNETAKLLYD